MEKWLFGVLLTIISAAGSTTGLILQKMAHVKEEEQPGAKYFGIPCNKYFIAGFIMLVLVPLPFDFLALANAGQSIVLPVGTGCTVVFGQILAPKILHEKLTKLDVAATTCIVCGTFISTLTGTHESPTYKSKTLLHLYTMPPFIITIIFVFITTSFCVLFAHNETFVVKYFCKVPNSIKIPILAYIPSSIGAVQIMIFKMTGELTKNTFEGYEEKYVTYRTINETSISVTKTRQVFVNEFLNPLLYVCLLLVIAFAIAQLSYLNRGLAVYNAIKFLPIYNTLLLMVGVTCGAIYFQEYEAFHPIWFPIGVFFEMCGILALSWKTDEKNAVANNDDRESNNNDDDKNDSENYNGQPYHVPSTIDTKNAEKNDNTQNLRQSPFAAVKQKILPRSHEKVHPLTSDEL